MQVFDYRISVKGIRDPKLDVRHPGLEGFEDVSALLGSGVFVLMLRGKCVYVGKINRGSNTNATMLTRIAALRTDDRPTWLPSVQFDQIFVRYVHPDKVGETYRSLVAELRPSYNIELIPSSPSPPIQRRPL
jgi:hypothetical protein